jgi:hypothetical protein
MLEIIWLTLRTNFKGLCNDGSVKEIFCTRVTHEIMNLIHYLLFRLIVRHDCWLIVSATFQSGNVLWKDERDKWRRESCCCQNATGEEKFICIWLLCRFTVLNLTPYVVHFKLRSLVLFQLMKENIQFNWLISLFWPIKPIFQPIRILVFK